MKREGGSGGCPATDVLITQPRRRRWRLIKGGRSSGAGRKACKSAGTLHTAPSSGGYGCFSLKTDETRAIRESVNAYRCVRCVKLAHVSSKALEGDGATGGRGARDRGP